MKQLRSSVTVFSGSPSIFLLFVLMFSKTGCQWVIDTDAEVGGNSQLEAIAQNVSHTKSVSIVINGSRPLELQDKVKFENVSGLNVSVRGGTLIDCVNKREVGISFINSTNIVILGLNMSRCSYQLDYNSALLFYNCQHVKLDNISIGMSPDFALLFWDTRGNIRMKNTTIYSACLTSPNCSGFGIVSTQCPSNINKPNNYTIHNCTFHKCNTNVSMEIAHDANNDFSLTEFGGGVGIVFKKRACSNKVRFTNCTISGNSAYWGGGMFLLQRGEAKNTSVVVNHTNFSDNSAIVGGGGVTVGFLTDFQTSVHSTKFVFHNCTFTRNSAKYGGGTSIFSTHMNYFVSQASLSFTECTWKTNMARFANDVDLAPAREDKSGNSFLPIVEFIDARFLSNQKVHSDEARFTTLFPYASYGSFSSTLFTVNFGGKVLFKDLQNTALHLSSSTVKFLPGSHVTFADNKGTNGGALAMYGFSALQLGKNCTLNFTRNQATVFGGAIYFETADKHEFLSNSKCFIQFIDNSIVTSERKVSVTFTDNSAERAGDSIYALTLLPCYFEWNTAVHNESLLIPNSVFDNIGKFTFTPVNRSIATAGVKFNSTNNTKSVIPGQCFQFEVKMKDELGQESQQIFSMTVLQGNIELDRHNLNHNICISGTPDEKGVVQVETMGFRKYSYYINVTMLPCPPGFFYDESKAFCKCGVETEEHAYTGITKCNMKTFQAVIHPDYWAGYIHNKLHTAPCPLGFCKHVHKLPQTNDSNSLNKLICGERRRGILCGECQENLSIYYHSPKFTCGESDHCSLGVIFYVVSEIIPLLILFSIIILFDIRLTFGIANALTLFAQVLNVVSVNDRGIINFPSSMERVADSYRVIYGVFNFDFLGVERLAFCLWKDATVLDMLAFKYITIIVAVIFVFLLILSLNYCHCKRVCVIKKKMSSKESVIHGLTAILVMSYSQCTKVSFEILRKATLYSEGKIESKNVTFYGGVDYFKQEHIRYAIPAGVCLVTVVTLLPLLLLIYPLYLKVFALCRAGESRPAVWVSRVLMIKKLRPFLDSFQGSYKDNFRFFSSLYFLYRIAILSASAFSSTFLQAHLITALISTLMIGIHATTWPYKKTLHNVSDIFILVNIALVNGLSLYAYVLRSFSENYGSTITFVTSLQAILIFLPVLAVLLYFALRGIVTQVCLRIRMHTESQEESSHEDLELDSFDQLIDHEKLPYQEFGLT